MQRLQYKILKEHNDQNRVGVRWRDRSDGSNKWHMLDITENNSAKGRNSKSEEDH